MTNQAWKEPSYPLFQLFVLDCFPDDQNPYADELEKLERRGLSVKKQSSYVNAIEWALPALLTLAATKTFEGAFAHFGKDIYAYFKKAVKALSKKHNIYYASPSAKTRSRAPTFRIDARVVMDGQHYMIHFCQYKNSAASETLLQEMLQSAENILENPIQLRHFVEKLVAEAVSSPYNTRETPHQRTWFFVYYNKRQKGWRYIDDDKYAFKRAYSQKSQRELLPLMKQLKRET